MKILRYILLLPFSLLYGLTVFLRNCCYDYGIFKTYRFHQKVISVGNISVGGTGKTPHTEYLTRLLSDSHRLAILSRGYKRKTKGFILADEHSYAPDIGDEPLQYRKKFKDIVVAVDEKRVHGIEEILRLDPKTEVFLLDDAYQHRSVYRGMNILITDYNHLYCHDHLLPGGTLREWRSGSQRADLIIISKTPPNLPDKTQEAIAKKLNPLARQKVFFTGIQHGAPCLFNGKQSALPDKSTHVLALCGIGNPSPFLAYCRDRFTLSDDLIFRDHHAYSISDIQQIISRFEKLSVENKAIITTEKDIMRLYLPELKNALADIPVFYLPIEVCFQGNGKEEFDNEILSYVRSDQRDERISST
ncbi:MAG: tetraacyldisaccharide 4'-kinase [Flavobacteriales bacterium]|nr:tetraacyldisaccharide 4'-kinase [Flavobacteriales bacterium]